MNATYRLRTPPGAGAIAVIDLAGDIDAALAALGVAPVEPARAPLRNLAGVDSGIVARWTHTSCSLMPHGGESVIRALCAALERAGLRSEEPAPLDAFPEACDEIEALTLRAIARVESPRAVDLLLRQPDRWRAYTGDPDEGALGAHARLLAPLLRAPVVAAVGPANIGKSTLLNALARRAVSLVHDAPGVTRDHVGASLVLDGLAVRWLDTPGVRPGIADPVDRDAMAHAAHAARAADLIVLCADASSAWIDPVMHAMARPGQPVLRVALRADLGPVGGAQIRTAATTGEGLSDLARAVRTAIVPDAALRDPSPWLFDEALLRPLSLKPDAPRRLSQE